VLFSSVKDGVFSCSKRTVQLHQSQPKLANERPCTYSGTQATQQSKYKNLSVKNGYILELNKYEGVLQNEGNFTLLQVCLSLVFVGFLARFMAI